MLRAYLGKTLLAQVCSTEARSGAVDYVMNVHYIAEGPWSRFDQAAVGITIVSLFYGCSYSLSFALLDKENLNRTCFFLKS